MGQRGQCITLYTEEMKANMGRQDGVECINNFENSVAPPNAPAADGADADEGGPWIQAQPFDAQSVLLSRPALQYWKGVRKPPFTSTSQTLVVASDGGGDAKDAKRPISCNLRLAAVVHCCPPRPRE